VHLPSVFDLVIYPIDSLSNISRQLVCEVEDHTDQFRSNGSHELHTRRSSLFSTLMFIGNALSHLRLVLDASTISTFGV
jgi:hypothetical protein